MKNILLDTFVVVSQEPTIGEMKEVLMIFQEPPQKIITTGGCSFIDGFKFIIDTKGRKWNRINESEFSLPSDSIIWKKLESIP